MSKRPLTDAELMQIIEDDEFWKDGNEVNNEPDTEQKFPEVDDRDDRFTAVTKILDSGDASDADESDHEQFSEHDSESEIDWDPSDDKENQNNDSSGSENANQQQRNHQAFYGKDRTKWSQNAPVKRRTPVKNICTVLPGLKGPAKQNPPSTPLEAWRLLFSDGMIDQLLRHTNSKIEKMQQKYSKFKRRRNSRSEFSASFINKTDKNEIEAFIGLLYFLGIFKSGHEDIRSLWASDGTGRDIFRCTMSLARFSFLLCSLRFDDEQSRRQRVEEDKLAAISDLFTEFIQNSKECYSPGFYLTVDEMLVPFRGRCRFRMYMPNKPAKYGIKVQVLTDAKTHYMVKSEVYTGKRNTVSTQNLSIPTEVVLRLVEPVAGSNRNVTGDNWYTSMELVDELKKHKLTYVGTVKKNKRFVPPEFLPSKDREIGTAIFGFTSDMTIVSHVPKKRKSVILLSSMHSDSMVDQETSKPDMILFYNETKGGVDALDQKCANYSTSRRTRRWPMALFHMILNISGVNSRVLYNFSPTGKEIPRFDFLKQLAHDLCEPHARARICNIKIPRKLRNLTADIFGVVTERPSEPQQRENVSKRKRCGICPGKMDRKTNTSCHACKIPICAQCSIKVCPNCIQL